MSEMSVSTEEKGSAGRLVLPSLFVSEFATQPSAIVTGLLLVDIGLTFGYPVGVTGQIRTGFHVASVIFALLMGVLSLRFRHKFLLVVGLLLFGISALGCAFAPSFDTMLVSYSIGGLGMAMVAPMCLTLVGEHFPREKRGSVIGWVFSGQSIAYVVGTPVIGFIAGFGGWRLAFLGFVLPIALFSLVLAIRGVPSTRGSQQSGLGMRDYLAGFKRVFSFRSADACLVGTALSMAAWAAVLTYSASFYRQRFLVSTGFASIFLLVAALCVTVGNLIGGRLVKRIGRKPLTVLAALFVGIFTVSYASLQDIWVSLAAAWLASFFHAVKETASNSLTLEQVPEFRGTMMSINSAAGNLGSSLGAGVGGLVVLLFNYEGMAMALGAMSFTAAMVYQLLAIDPAKTGMQTHS